MAGTATVTERTLPRLMSGGLELDTSPDRFGELRPSMDAIDDPETLNARMHEDGYLYLPGYLDRDLVLEARRAITDKLAAQGHLAAGTPPMDAFARPGNDLKFKPDLADDNEPLDELLYSGRMMEFYRRLLGGPILHFDYTWMRAVAPGKGTAPHGDSVFMNRGTSRLYTAWTPLGDTSYELGGLIVLEKSHRLDEIVATYGQRDVDSFCENEEDAALYSSGEKWWNGSLTDDPIALARQLGLRWLTTEFQAGDLLTFTIYTLHASLDNQSDRIRLSSDTRYQLASEPADERWVGERPIGHGAAGKRGRIC
jgi:ectoine hydroxylase-related dioxygenase (phytanoyl-CoA dioxygenase family)